MFNLISKVLLSFILGIFNICLIALVIGSTYKIFISRLFFIKFFERNLSKKVVTKIVVISTILLMVMTLNIYLNLENPEKSSLILKFIITILAIPFARKITIWFLGNPDKENDKN